MPNKILMEFCLNNLNSLQCNNSFKIYKVYWEKIPLKIKENLLAII